MSRDARTDGAAGAAPFIFENLQELIARFNQALGTGEFAAVHSIIDALFTIVIDDDEDGAPNPLEQRVDLLVQGMNCLAHVMYKECSSDRDSSTAQLISHYEAVVAVIERHLPTFLPQLSSLPPSALSTRFLNGVRDFYMIAAYINKNLSIDLANQQSFESSLEAIEKAQQWYRKGGQLLWDDATEASGVRDCFREYGLYFMEHSQYSQIVTFQNLSKTEHEINEAKSRKTLQHKFHQYQQRAERAISKNQFATAVDECLEALQMMQANPKLHGDEWFQDLKARLERMHQEASAKKRPAKDKGRSKGGKHQDSVPDVPVRSAEEEEEAKRKAEQIAQQLLQEEAEAEAKKKNKNRPPPCPSFRPGREPARDGLVAGVAAVWRGSGCVAAAASGLEGVSARAGGGGGCRGVGARCC